MIPVRRGATIAEMAVALLLAGSAAAVGAGMLVSAERRTRRDSHDSLSSQTARDVLHVLGAEIAAARWESVVVRGDTALDLQSHVGVSVACAASGDLLILPPVRTTLVEPYTEWRVPPEATDSVIVWDTAGTWQSARIDSVANVNSGCAAGGPFRSAADSATGASLTRLRLSRGLAASPGTPVRVYRSLRWMLYRGGDNRWWFGQRRCASGACGAAQPVAGPLAPPGDTGLRFAASPDGGVEVSVRGAVPGSRAPLSRAEFSVRGAPRAAP
jgi:hypothetical protein